MPRSVLGKSFRRYVAQLLTAIYAMMIFSPLAPHALQPANGIYAASGECSGDCSIDSCSLESRLKHSCCWQKKQRLGGDVSAAQGSQCAIPAGSFPIQVNSTCCAPKAPPVSPPSAPSCCSTYLQELAMASPDRDTPGSQPVLKCGCPCGDSKELAQWGGGKSELVPYAFAGFRAVSYAPPYPHLDPKRLTSRHGDPPDPPPKLTSLA
jgi:hypothetical protein